MFDETRTFPVVLPDLAPVAQALVERFRAEGYDADSVQTATRGWDISISKGGAFKAVLGLKTALKLLITPVEGGTSAHLSVGIFGRQAVPSLISLLVAWPVALAQVWGIVQQRQLDHAVLEVLEASLRSHAAAAAPGRRFCTDCGAAISADAHFGPGCGHALAAEGTVA